MIGNLRQLWRSLRRSPASALAAIVTLSLTLGIGASIFAVVDAVVLTPPPFADPGRLVFVGPVPADQPDGAPRPVSFATFQAWRDRAGSLASMEAFDGTNLTITGLSAAERLNAINVTPGLLALLGVTPSLGRSFDADDAGQPVAIVSHAFWQRKLGGDPGAIGRQIVLGGVSHTIVGILPPRAAYAFSPDIWRPFPLLPAQAVRGGVVVLVLARLAPRASASDLSSALQQIEISPEQTRVVVTSLATATAGDARRALALLGGAGVLALLVAIINLAGLLVVRAIDRRRELAVRTALGAGPLEGAKQLLVEAAGLVSFGTAGGLLLALWTTPIAARLAFEQFGGVASRDVAVNGRVIAAVVLLAAACAVICTALPAVLGRRASVVDALRRGTTPATRERLVRRVFVTGEVALAFALLASVGFLGRSLIGVLGVNPGFDARDVLVLQVSLPSPLYPGPGQVDAFYSNLRRALEDRLGAGQAAIVDEIPLSGYKNRTPVGVPGSDAGRDAVVRAASAGYFDVMRIPVIAGRPLDASDAAAAPLRAVVSESLAARLFPAGQPLGRAIWLSTPSRLAEIVGVVGDVTDRALDDAPTPAVYLSISQAPSNSSIVVVRGPRSHADVTGVVREAVARLDPNLPVYGVRTLEDLVRASPGVPTRRLMTAAFGGFALLALALGAVGLFGVMAHDVARRRAELALRIALGASREQIWAATLVQAGWMLTVGLAVGGILTIWTSRTIASLFPSSATFDAVSIGGAAAILVLTALAAVIPSALKAARTDPLLALRSE